VTTTQHTHPDVVPTVTAEIPRLAHLLSAAFATDPVSDWLFQGEQDTHHPAFFTAFLRLAHIAGHIDQTSDGTAVALWIDRTGTRNTTTAHTAFHREIVHAIGHHAMRWHLLDATLTAAHPEHPHWWLAFLAVHPNHQQRGHGNRLLHHAHTRHNHQTTYLEATSRRLTSYYQNHGYQPSAHIHIPTGPPLHPMTRPATTT
jgi:ribosomal protein S18 acetylase RimI-like enzyme